MLGVWALAGANSASMGSAQACEVSLGLSATPPLSSVYNQKASGIVAEVTILALRRIGCRAKPRQLPYPRLYHWINGGLLDVAAPVRRTSQRAALAHYSPPIITEYTVVMVPRGKAFPFEAPDDLMEKSIGAQMGVQYPALSWTDVSLHWARTYDVNILRVARRRLDGVLVGSLSGQRIANELELDDIVEILPNALGAVSLRAALSTENFSESMRAKFDSAIRDILAGAAWTAILKRNGVKDHPEKWPLVRARAAP